MRFVGVALGFGLLLSFSYYAITRVERNTVYASPSVKLEFRKVQVGTAVSDLYRLLGPPLVISINPDKSGTGAYRQTIDHDTRFEHVHALLRDEILEVYLYYSLPKNFAHEYYMYRIDASGGKVVQLQGRIRMD